MIKKRFLHSPLIFALPFLVVISSVFISFYFPINRLLSIGITADLVLTFPLLYLAAIWQIKIPKTTVVPVLVIGILVGTLILPEDQQGYLDVIKHYVLPLLELFVLLYIIYGIYNLRRRYQATEASDFYTRLLIVSQELFPEKISYFMASELSVPYYCFFCWKAPILNQNQFSYHKKSGNVALLWAFIMILIVETIALHFIVNLWSTNLAWVLTVLSVYTCFQVLGLIKSVKERPIEITEKELWLKYGTLREAHIPLEAINQVRDYDRVVHSKEIFQFSPLGEFETPNLYLEFKYPIMIRTTFGKQNEYTKLLLSIDNKEMFKECLIPI
jgi:hypothetical protein